MSEVIPATGSSPSIADQIAIKRVEVFAASELGRTQTRGEKWIAGVTALTGLVATALVVKGKDSFAKLDPAYDVFGVGLLDPAGWVAVLLALALAAFALATFSAYSAAFGNPFTADELDDLLKAVQETPDDAATKLRDTVGNRADSSRRHLRSSITVTFVGLALTVVAVGITWRVPDKAASTTLTCIEVGAEEPVPLQFDGALPAVAAGRYEVVPCP